MEKELCEAKKISRRASKAATLAGALSQKEHNKQPQRKS